MIFEMLWLGGILLYAGLFLWGYAVNRLPRTCRLPGVAIGRAVAPNRGDAISTTEAPR
jgi:hypothetical protein